MLTHDKSSHGLWPGELKMHFLKMRWTLKTFQRA
jgi:hypothetical protein